jgi:hypothetical protein
MTSGGRATTWHGTRRLHKMILVQVQVQGGNSLLIMFTELATICVVTYDIGISKRKGWMGYQKVGCLIGTSISVLTRICMI